MKRNLVTALVMIVIILTVQAEDTLHYAEPESWRIPVRHFLGQAYIQSGNYTKAQQVFEEDLKDHPGNFWAVNGLQQVLLKQQKTADVATLQKKYAHVFELADARLNGAVF